jgi:hypothetical protein
VSIIIFTPFYIYKSKIIAFFNRKISSFYKVLTSFSSLLEAKLRFISYKSLISFLTLNIIDL